MKPSKMAEADSSLKFLLYEYTKLKFRDDIIKKTNDMTLKVGKRERNVKLGLRKKTHQGDRYPRSVFFNRSLKYETKLELCATKLATERLVKKTMPKKSAP